MCATDAEPSVRHGLGRVVAGSIFEWPKTILEATFDGPPVVGTMIGVLAGAARATQEIVGGVLEMGAGFDPWGTKRTRR